MRVTTRVATVANEGVQPQVRTARIDRVWAATAITAAVLFAVAAFLPLWTMTLRAPQYPDGLTLTAYGWRLAGDLGEINGLNHYVGIQTLDPEAIRELALFPFAVGALIAALVAAAFVRRPVLRWLVVVAAWGMPLGMLADLQWWLHTFGHNLNPAAPIRLEPFTPKVLGTTSVINFHSETMVAVGFWLMIAAALVLTIGPWLIRFTRDSWANTGTAAQAAVLVVALVAGMWVMAPREATASEQQSIGAAIAAAAPGDTVVIPAGTYVEQLVIDNPVVLVGEGRPVIDGGGAGDVVHITAPDVTLRGFVVRNSARIVTGEPTGIRVTADRATIEDNEVREVLYGIALQNSNGHTVRRNSVTSFLDMAPERRGHALYIWYSDGNEVADNVLEYAKDGIFLGFTTNTTLERNTVTHVRYGLHTIYAGDLVLRGNAFRDNVAGGSLMYSRGLLIADNEFSGNYSPASGYGLLFKDMDDVRARRQPHSPQPPGADDGGRAEDAGRVRDRARQPHWLQPDGDGAVHHDLSDVRRQQLRREHAAGRDARRQPRAPQHLVPRRPRQLLGRLPRLRRRRERHRRPRLPLRGRVRRPRAPQRRRPRLHLHPRTHCARPRVALVPRAPPHASSRGREPADRADT